METNVEIEVCGASSISARYARGSLRFCSALHPVCVCSDCRDIQQRSCISNKFSSPGRWSTDLGGAPDSAAHKKHVDVLPALLRWTLISRCRLCRRDADSHRIGWPGHHLGCCRSRNDPCGSDQRSRRGRVSVDMAGRPMGCRNAGLAPMAHRSALAERVDPPDLLERRTQRRSIAVSANNAQLEDQALMEQYAAAR